MIRIDNDGPEITGTNYFQLANAVRDLAYLSLNAGALRLLVPAGLAVAMRRELGTVKSVDAEFLESNDRIYGRRGVALWFDDGSSSPYRLDIQAEQVDRWPAAEDHGKAGKILVYYADKFPAAREWPCKIVRK